MRKMNEIANAPNPGSMFVSANCFFINNPLVKSLKVERWLHRKYFVKTEAKNEWRSLSNEEVFSFIDDCKEADNNISFLLENNPFYK